MGKSRTGRIMVLVVVAVAIALGAVGVYARQREVIVGSLVCGKGRINVNGECRSSGSNYDPLGNRPAVDTAIPSHAVSGPLSHDAAAYWWYGAGAFLVLGLMAVSVVIPRAV